MQYYSLQHWALLFTTRHLHNEGYFPFDPTTSFFLELSIVSNCICCFSVAYQTPSNLGSSSSRVISFLPFHTVHEVLQARILKWFAIPFSSAPHFVKLFPVTHLSLVALHGMAHSFIELDKANSAFCLPSDG